MASWQPPIPSGALWCEPVRNLGPAQALFAYLYDIVKRDGVCEMKLTQVAAAMNEPYPNVKHWWQAIEKANEKARFFSEITHRGTRGLRVQFNPKWLEWRVLSTRQEASEPSGAEVIPIKEETGSSLILFDGIGITNGIAIGTNEGSEVIPNEQCNKVLIDQDQADIADAAKAAPPAPPASQKTSRKKPERTPEEQAYLDRKKAIETAYVEALGYKPSAFVQEAKAAKWLAEQGYTPEQVTGCLRHLQADDWYAGKHISLQTVSKQIGAWVQANKPKPKPAAPETKYYQSQAHKYLQGDELRAAFDEAARKRARIRSVGEA